MRKFFSILLIMKIVSTLHAQTDTIRCLRGEFYFPFSGGFSYIGNSSNSTQASPLLMNERDLGGFWQVVSFQLHIKNNVFAAASYTLSSLRSNREKALGQLQKENPNYFIQQESKYQEVDGWSYNVPSLDYWKFGVGMNLHLNKERYLQPCASFCTGRSTLPNGLYAFKEYTSNHFFVNDYQSGKSSATGFAIGLEYKRYAKTDEEGMFRYGIVGISLGFTHLATSGTGTITSADVFLNESVSTFSFEKSWNIISVGVLVAVSGRIKTVNH